MNKILDGLYVGNFRDAKDEEQLKQNKITHILSIHDNAKELLEDKKYLCITASDCAQQDLTQYFPRCIEFIHKARLANGGVLVHCLAGVSRSVTIVAAYIMTVTNLGWRDTLHAIRGARNCANPNFGFQRQLQDYENEGLEEARQKLKSDYPPSPYNDVQDCDVLSKSYRNYLNLGDTDSYDGLYMLPHGAYGSKGKVKTDEDSGDVKNDSLGDSDTGDAENMQTNGEVSEDTEESCKGKELVEKEKWEVTPVSTAQEGSSGSKSKS